MKARAHAMAQRSSLYARDELEMSVMRIRVRHPHESVAVHEEAFKLHPAEVPVRNKVCSLLVPQRASSQKYSGILPHPAHTHARTFLPCQHGSWNCVHVLVVHSKLLMLTNQLHMILNIDPALAWLPLV